jgi:RES domain-containing protein
LSRAAVSLWRIATEAPGYGATDLTGRGAELTGGRWNRKGVAMVYTSTTRALACLETLVHFEASARLPLNRYLVRIQVPPDSWKHRRRLGALGAHAGWDAEPPGRVSRDFGSQWAADNKSLLLEVPSIVVAEEFNVLINPKHADISRVRAENVRKFTYDARLRA